ncbi:MAG TPA: hypothetical protein VMT00_00660 [Thermoanaerobaculia bacterium]|nr:hypothetical protein [Thermoanaerobaculia bacterium]
MSSSLIHRGPFVYHQGRIQWEGISIPDLALRPPFFLLSEAAILRNFRALRDTLGQSVEAPAIRYCAKTNHELAVLSILARAGCDVLVSHPAEGDLAARAGFAPETMSFQKPALDEDDIAWILRTTPGLVHVHRPEDLRRLAAVKSPGPLQISIRVADDLASWTPSLLGFATRRLGFTRDEVLEVASGKLDDPLRVVALNCYIGTQQSGVKKFRRALDRLFLLLVELRSRGVPVAELNLGGGIPSTIGRLGPRDVWSRFRDLPKETGQPRLVAFARKLGEEFRDAARRHGVTGIRLAVEPGRSIVGDAAVLVTRIEAIHGDWLFLDASRNVLGESPIMFRRAIGPAVIRDGARPRYYHLSGNTLNTLDVIDVRRRLDEPSQGDLLVFADAGAYTISRTTRYAGLAPAVYLLSMTGEVTLVRRRENLDDLIAPMMIDGASTAGE